MAKYGSGTTIARYAPKLVMGGLLCLSIMFFVVAAIIVLSLIPLYTANRGEIGYGEHYQIKTLVIKALGQNISFTANNATVTDSRDLSLLFTSIYQDHGVANLKGCIATNFHAFSGNTSNFNRRRRREIEIGLYEIGELNIYYSTSCSHKNDESKYITNTSLSTCVKNRLIECNNLVNGSLNASDWTRFSNPFLQTITNNASNQSLAIVEAVVGFPFLTAQNLASILINTTDINNHIRKHIFFLISTMNLFLLFFIKVLGCQFIGQVSQQNIDTALASQEHMPTSTSSG
ncbi:unnamed protein product [Adineta steineri]|uniref:Uncharacterized protein n=1 Tax=Adineta steineri TaxID=433720 RepID=A0A815PUE1_9BILA|nr:unnamed protein product [Adineta steineri]